MTSHDPLTVLVDRACDGTLSPDEAEQLRSAVAQLRRSNGGLQAKVQRQAAQLVAVQTHHAPDHSNPSGPWCPTCIRSWPCDTARALQ